MRTHGKTVLLALLAATALSATSAASASAETCASNTKEGSKVFQLCINNEVPKEAERVPLLSTTTQSFAVKNIPAAELELTCKTIAEKSYLDYKPSSALGVEMSPHGEGCGLVEDKKCKVQKDQLPFSGTALDGTLTSAELIKVEASESKVFQVELEGTECKLPLKAWASGYYTCTLHEPKVQAVDHELQCTSGERGSELNYGDNELPMHYSQTISLGGTRTGDKFGIYEAK